MHLPEGAVRVPEAAARLGVSVDTVRRRVQAGQLESVPLERGYAVVLSQQPAPDESLLAEITAERDRLLRQVEFLQRQLEETTRSQAALVRLLEAASGAKAHPRGDGPPAS